MVYADNLVVNGVIHTLDDENRRVSALAIKDGRILETGSRETLEYLKGPATRVIDAAGFAVVPGFNDAHSHLLSLRGQQLLQLDCSPASVSSVRDIIRLIKEKAAGTPRGQWILAGSYDFSKLKENRHPTRYELDEATTDHPVHLRSQTCHVGVVNSRAFQEAGIANDTPDPFGGEFERDEKGVLTGLCKEEAHFLFVTGMGTDFSFVPPYTTEELVTALKRSCREYNGFGITSAGDGLVGPHDILAYQAALSEGALNVRVYMNILDAYLDDIIRSGFRTGFGNDMLKVGAIKSFVDGAVAAHTAWLSEPYGHRPGYYGIPTKSREDLEALVMKAHAAGFQMEIHANGDRAISMLLDAYEKAQTTHPGADRRHRIAHCTLVTPEILERIKKLRVVVLPFSTYIYEHGEKMAPYGERISMMFPHRSFLDYGIPVGGSSDNPCATENPMIALQAMVTRTSSGGLLLGSEQKVTLEEALRIYTRGSAYATFEESVKGALAPGMLADFVFLDTDPFEADPFSLGEIRVLKTFVDGRTVFEG